MYCAHPACLESKVLGQESQPVQHSQPLQRPVACLISSVISVCKCLCAPAKKKHSTREPQKVSEGILPHLCSLFSLSLPILCLVLKIMFLVLWAWNILRAQGAALGSGCRIHFGYNSGVSCFVCFCSSGYIFLKSYFKGLSLQLKQKLLIKIKGNKVEWPAVAL